MTKRNRPGEKEGYNLECFQKLETCYLQTLRELYPKTILIGLTRLLITTNF